MSDIWEKFVVFNLPYLSLPVSTKKDTALDVFIKMNSSAAPLSTYDIVVAQVEAGMGKSLHGPSCRYSEYLSDNFLSIMPLRT